MRIVVAFPLAAQIVGERVEIEWAEGLGPVTGLPSEAPRKKATLVDVVRGGALHALDEVGKGDRGRDAQQDVNVVGPAACGEQRAGEVVGFVAEDGGEQGVEGRGQDVPSMARGPDDVNEDECRRAARHT